MTSQNPLHEEIDKATTSITDLKLIMKKPIPENATPYDRQAMEYTHKMIDDFFKDVVLPTAKNGQINCSFVVDSWSIYQEGKEAEITYNLLEHMLEVSKEDVEFWKKVFDLPVEEMLK